MSVSHIDWTGALLLAGRYQILRRLGEGGMALVYLARDRKLDTQVVIKVPQPEVLKHPNFAGRFQREVQLMVKLSHKHIVRVLDSDMHEGQPFAVLEYLAGGTLRVQQPRDPGGRALPMPMESLHAWLEDIAAALDYIHQNEYIHRDVKPANILFDNQGHAYLADFGIAKTLSDPSVGGPATTFTQQGTILGTPQYMAPEMILGKSFDHRVDQYALAVTVYECLAGRYPFDGPNPTAIFVQQAKETAPRLNELVPGLPRKLASAVNRAMNKQASQRFPTCLDFVRLVLAETPSPKHGRIVLSTHAARSSPAKVKPDTEPLQNATPPAERAPIPLGCPNCGKKILVRLSKPQHRFRCPHCKAPFSIAPPPPPPAALAPGVVPPPLLPRAELVDVPIVDAYVYATAEEESSAEEAGEKHSVFWICVLMCILGAAVAAVYLLIQ